VLLTGFEPFGGDAVNPSGDAVRTVAARWSGPDLLIAAVLPVSFAAAAERLAELLAAHAPDLVIATGLAGGRAEIAVERVAVNLADARIPDNDGSQPVDEESLPGAPAALFATLPIKRIVGAIAEQGIPAVASLSAGSFVCNHVFLHAAAWAARTPGSRAGFVHVPWAEGQGPGGAPALPAADIAVAIETAVRVSLAHAADAAIVGGSLH